MPLRGVKLKGAISPRPPLGSWKNRGLWFVVRKILPLDKNGLWLNLTSGRPPLLSVLAAALHLPIVGTWRTRKALGVPP